MNKISRHFLIFSEPDPLTTTVMEVAEEAGFEIRQTLEINELFQAIDSLKPIAIFVQLMMTDSDGVEVIRKIAERKTGAKICFLASGTNQKVLMTAHRLGISLGLNMINPLTESAEISGLNKLFSNWWNENYTVSKADIEVGIQERQFTLFYQPKIQLNASHEGGIDEVEALVRWKHPDLGLISPGAFIPLVERTDLIGPLTDLVLDMALQQIKAWQTDGMEIKVGVNLSLQSLTDLSLPDQLTASCKSLDVHPSSLVLEITETAAMGNNTILPDILTRLRLKGFELAMDDFGTGYSSLVQLYRLPFSELKIDQSFVMETETQEEARIIVLSILNLADNLGLISCAEGVETSSMFDYCRSIGCDKVQGYYISKPLPAPEFTRFVKHWDPELGVLATEGTSR